MLPLSKSDIASMTKTADAAVANALSGKTTGWLTSAPTTEPNAVAAIVSVGLPDAASGWSGVLKPMGYSVNVIGVFCHQTPMASFTDSSGNPQTRELADLLVVIDEKVSGSIQDRRAVLVQAKIAHWPNLILTGIGDLAQFDLFVHWHPFTLPSPPYAPNLRDFTSKKAPGKLRDGRDYGAIDLLTSPTHPVRWQQIDANNPMSMSSGVSLGAAMSEMAAGNYGRSAIAGGTDDWSSTVDELLRITFNAPAGGKLNQPKRGVATLTYFVVDNGVRVGLLAPGGGGRPPGDAITDLAPEDGRMSVVHVTLERQADISAFR